MVKTIVFVSIIIIIFFFFLCKRSLSDKHDTYTGINVKKNCRFKHTCNDDAGIGRRKQQKLVYRIFTCKFSVSSLQCHDLLTLQRRDQKFTCENMIH